MLLKYKMNIPLVTEENLVKLEHATKDSFLSGIEIINLKNIHMENCYNEKYVDEEYELKLLFDKLKHELLKSNNKSTENKIRLIESFGVHFGYTYANILLCIKFDISKSLYYSVVDYNFATLLFRSYCAYNTIAK